MYGSGLRVSEVTGLTIERLDLDGARVLVLGKGSKEREVPMSDFAVDALRAWIATGRPRLAAEGSRALFVNRQRRPLTPATLVVSWIGTEEGLLPGRRVDTAHPAAFVRHPSA